MKFTVTWSVKAENELARLWYDAVDRHRLSEAANEIDAALRSDAHHKGIEFSEHTRYLECGPLTVIFSASIEDRIVTVLYVETDKEETGSE